MWTSATPSELKALSDPIGNGVFVLAVEGEDRFRVLSINRRIEEFCGIRHADVSGKLLNELLQDAEYARVAQRYRRCLQTAQRDEYDETLTLFNRRSSWRTVLTPLLDAEGRVVRLLGSTAEVSERRRLEKELEESEQRLQLAIKGAELGIWEWDIPNGRLRVADDWGPEISPFSGLTDISIKEWIQLIHPDDREQALATGTSALNRETLSYRVEYRTLTQARDWVWVEVHGTVVEQDEQGQPLRVCGTYRDIDRQKADREALRQLTQELRHRALHDSLTGALNHGAILDAMEKEMARARRHGGAVTLVLVDADHFKEINDRHGHQTGDEVLVGLVRRIREVLRPYDLLGRYGGEEFLVVAPGPDGAADLHERIREAVATQPFSTRSGLLEVTVSVGLAEYDGNEATTAENLLAAADAALYRAKSTGRNLAMQAHPADFSDET